MKERGFPTHGLLRGNVGLKDIEAELTTLD